MAHNFNDLIDAFKRGAGEDKVGLWEIIILIKRDFHVHGEDQIMAMTLEFVKQFLAAGFQAGDSVYLSTGYVPWKNQSPDYVINRIKTEWQALGRIPNIGDIVYFDIPGYKYP